MSELIQRRTQDEMVASMAAYLPGGDLFEAATIAGTNFNGLLNGLSHTLLDADNFLYLYNSQFIPDQTTAFIEEWESTLGIPDGCFPGTGTNEERRLHILVKLASLGVQTAADFENLATILGFPNTIVKPGVGSGGNLVTNGTFDTDSDWTKGAGWAISGGTANKSPGVASTFPVPFPIVFGSTLLQSIAITQGEIYTVKYDVLNTTAGSVRAILGDTDGLLRTGNSTIIETIVPSSTGTLIAFDADADFDGSIDNVEVRGQTMSFGSTDPRFVIVVIFEGGFNNFPMAFPFEFGSSQFSILQCLFTKLKPANCDIIFTND